MAILRVLGCSGGFAAGRQTSSFLLDDHVLFDAGTGVGSLSPEQLAQIDDVFLTHAHLDHVLSLPLLLDVVQTVRSRPLKVYGLAETLQSLQKHLFNGLIWPTISELQINGVAPILFEAITVGQTIELDQGLRVTCLPALHAVSSCGYQLQNSKKSIVYTGDTCGCPEFWAACSEIESLQTLIIETSFFNAEQLVADRSFHLTPQALAQELEHLLCYPDIRITHLKPGREDALMQEILPLIKNRKVSALRIGDEICF